MTDREKLIELIDKARYGAAEMCREKPSCKDCPHWDDRPHCRSSFIADHLLANGVVVREKGEWKRVDHDGSWHVDKCSICHRRIHYVDYDQPYQFCPNCGADMRKGENG